MQIRILKGTTTIGGALTEITTSKGTKIMCDFGMDLDDILRLPEIDGLNTGEPTYDGVIISHYHGDHYGRINEVLPEIPVYMSDQARSIIETVFSFTRKGKITHPTIDIQDQVPFYVKEIKITPYTVDHSAYGAFMFLIEADNKRILYTGDYRNHGYKGKLFKPTLKKIR